MAHRHTAEVKRFNDSFLERDAARGIAWPTAVGFNNRPAVLTSLAAGRWLARL